MKFGKILALFVLVLLCQSGFAQDGAAPPVDGSLGEIMNSLLWIGAAIIAIIALIFMVRTNQLMYNRVLDLEAGAAGLPLPSEVKKAAKVTGPSLWQQLKDKYWEKVVPLEEEHTLVLNHDYDGIRELDNSLPPWWINMFYLTIIWAFGYMYVYHWGGDGPNQHQEYLMEVEEVERMKLIALASEANSVDETNVTVLTESGALSEGEMIFNANCVACHRVDGGGLVGPNLTDEYWVHGGGIADVFKTIKYGVQEKGMQEWGSRLSPKDIQNVSSYILSMKGSNPENPKAPEGEIWVAPTAAEEEAISEES